MVCVAETDSTNSSISDPKVSQFTSYYSTEFNEKGMRFLRLFNVGSGKFQPFLDITFVSGFKILKEFSKINKSY